MNYKTIKTEIKQKVAIITLNRPKALNALNSKLMHEVVEAAKSFDVNKKIGCIVITGSPMAFAAGADIKEMQGINFPDSYNQSLFAKWDELAKIKKPIIAGVAGYALGGGCELAMMCDFIIAAENAKFGQPEISLGVMPGMGGSQRLARFIGKAKTMDMCLTGRTIDAVEAHTCGLVARVVAVAELENTLLEMASKVAEFSQTSVAMIKESINSAFEMPLNEGLRLEKRLFYSLFATDDQKEGMAAFVEKRKAKFNHK